MPRPSSSRASSARALAPLLGFLLTGAQVLISPSARAATGDIAVKAEPGVTIPLTQPQTGRYGAGFALPVKLMYGLGQNLDLTLSLTGIALPLKSNSAATGTGGGWGWGAGVRGKFRRDKDTLLGVSPWIDADGMYVRTGDLNRVGFAVGAGLAFPLGERKKYWLGPYVRYLQIVGSGVSGVDSRDARLLFAGLSFEIGPAKPDSEPPPPPPPAPVICPAVVPCLECPAIARLPDRDGDGVPDKFDRCPDVVGPIENQGCPIYEKIIVREDKLELKEKIAFHWNTAHLDPVSFPLMDEVVKALKENKGFEVSVEGYASSEGGEAHNQTLSEQRSEAVLDYLSSHGISRTRLSSRGFGEHRPLTTNKTEEGREANRRVEFVVHFIIVNKDGSTK